MSITGDGRLMANVTKRLWTLFVICEVYHVDWMHKQSVLCTSSQHFSLHKLKVEFRDLSFVQDPFVWELHRKWRCWSQSISLYATSLATYMAKEAFFFVVKALRWRAITPNFTGLSLKQIHFFGIFCSYLSEGTNNSQLNWISYAIKLKINLMDIRLAWQPMMDQTWHFLYI